MLQQDIEQELERRGNIKAVILDASGIGSMDITAADRIEILYKSLKEQGIRFYITEHIADLNEQMKAWNRISDRRRMCQKDDLYCVERYGDQTSVSIRRRS